MPDDTDPGLTEVRPAGHMGMGLFAKKDIPRGTLIFAESPILKTPRQDTKEDLMRLCSEIDTLSPEMRAKLDQLYCHQANISRDYHDAIREWIKEQKMKDTGDKAEELASTKNFKNNKNEASIGKTNPDQPHETGEEVEDQSGSQGTTEAKTKSRNNKKKRIQDKTKAMNKRVAIFRSNCVAMGSKSEYGIGLFYRYSRINYSCLPNVNNRYNHPLRQLTVYATRDIKADEQLLVSYIKTQCRPRAVRQKELEVWGFTCTCLACTDLQMEVARRRMTVLDQRLASYHAVSRDDDGDDPFMTASRAEAIKRTGGQTPEDALHDAQELAKLQEEQGVRGMELALTYRECSLHSLECGRLPQAIEYAEKEEEEETAAIGVNEDLRSNPHYARHWVSQLKFHQLMERVERMSVGHVEEPGTSNSEE